LGEEQIVALLQESLSVAHRTGAIDTKDLERVAIDTTVQEKAIAHPTDARLTHRAIAKLVELAKREGVELRQSYLRLAKRAAIMVGRYTHAHQFKRARRELKFLRTRLGRIIRDIRRKIEGNTALEDRFGPLLDLALRVRHQEQRQRGPKVYSLHAPEVECIGRGKARAPYEFACKVSIATPVTAPKGGQFVLHAKALHGNPYDGPTTGPFTADLEKLTGVIRRIHGDKGYRGHNYPNRFKVWISGQVQRVTKAIRPEMRRRAAIEPVIGHLKEDHRMGRNYLTGRDGDRINAVLAAAGYNFSLLLRWFEELLRVLSSILCHALLAAPLHLTRCRKTFFTADALMTPEEIAARTRLEMEAGRNRVQQFASNPALQEQYMVDFVPAREAAQLPIDPDVKLPADIQASIARGKAAYRNFKKSWRKQELIRPKGPAGGPFFITSVVKNEEVQERRDAALSALEKQSEGKRGQPLMLFRLRVVLALVDRRRAEGEPFDTRPNSRMNKLVREDLNKMAARSRGSRKSRYKPVSARAMRYVLRQIK